MGATLTKPTAWYVTHPFSSLFLPARCLAITWLPDECDESPQRLRFPMLTFATKKPSTGANGQRGCSFLLEVCPRSFDRAVIGRLTAAPTAADPGCGWCNPAATFSRPWGHSPHWAVSSLATAESQEVNKHFKLWAPCWNHHGETWRPGTMANFKFCFGWWLGNATSKSGRSYQPPAWQQAAHDVLAFKFDDHVDPGHWWRGAYYPTRYLTIWRYCVEKGPTVTSNCPKCCVAEAKCQRWTQGQRRRTYSNILKDSKAWDQKDMGRLSRLPWCWKGLRRSVWELNPGLPRDRRVYSPLY